MHLSAHLNRFKLAGWQLVMLDLCGRVDCSQDPTGSCKEGPRPGSDLAWHPAQHSATTVAFSSSSAAPSTGGPKSQRGGTASPPYPPPPTKPLHLVLCSLNAQLQLSCWTLLIERPVATAPPSPAGYACFISVRTLACLQCAQPPGWPAAHHFPSQATSTSISDGPAELAQRSPPGPRHTSGGSTAASAWHCR